MLIVARLFVVSVAAAIFAGCSGAGQAPVPNRGTVAELDSALGAWADARPPLVVDKSTTLQTPISAPSEVAQGRESVLYRFRGGSNGEFPASGLTIGKNGVLYGTTPSGGAYGFGTVFELTPSGKHYIERVVYSFKGGTDGALPWGALLADKNGTLFGTTFAGGGTSNTGTAFELTSSKAGFVESVLYSFQNFSDGLNPIGGLLADNGGALYGTTEFGGGGTCGAGCGTAFKLTPSGAGYSEGVLYTFLGAFEGLNDGAYPEGALIADRRGALYGTTMAGGSGGCSSGCGTVFQLLPAGSGYAENVLYQFQGGNDGAVPNAGLVRDKDGALFGTTWGGFVYGTVFELAPRETSYSEAILHVFGSGADGAQPGAGLIIDANGALYGTTYSGGEPNLGTVFKVEHSRARYVETVLYSFQGGNDGASPRAPLLYSNALYGATTYGGPSNSCGSQGCGTVFEFVQ